MAIRIDARELIELLRLTPPAQNIMLIGKHGIGKSQIITAFYRQQEMRVITFIQKNPHHLDGEGVQSEDALVAAGLLQTPDRRAWVKVSNFIQPLEQLDDIHVKSIADIVGTQAAIAFQQSVAEAAKVTPEQILLNFSRHKKKLGEMSL